MVKQNSIIQHYELESFMRNVSLSNFTETLLKNKNILIDKDLNKSPLYDDERDKYFRSIISREIIEESFFEDLKNNIFYHNEDYIVEKKTKMDKVFDIDMSYFASNTVKEYMFYFDFLAEYYRNLAELKNKKHILHNELFDHEFNIKVRIIPVSKVRNYTSVSLNKDVTTNDKNYINLKFKLNNVNKDLDLTNIDSGTIFKTMQIEKDFNYTYADNIKWLFNKIQITNELSIKNKPDYNHLIGLSYRYRFYRLLLDYYVLIIYYIFIRYKREIISENTDYNTGGSIKYGEIKKVLEDFTIVFQNYTIKLMKLITIMESVDKDDRIQESERIAESITYKKKLKKINRNIDLRNTNFNRIESEIKHSNMLSDKSKTTFISSIVVLVISLFIYLSVINTNSIESSRIISSILFMFIITYILIMNYYMNNNYKETFEDSGESTIDERIKEYETDKQYSESDTQKVMEELLKRKDAIVAADIGAPINNWDEESGIETIIDKTAGQYKDDAEKTWHEEAKKRRDDKTQYYQNLTTYEDIDQARSEHVKKLEDQLIELNNEYRETLTTEREVIQRRADVKGQLTTVADALNRTEAAVTSRFKTIKRMEELLEEYQNLTDKLGGIVARKTQIRELKIEKASQLSSENNVLAKKIRDKYQEIADSQVKFDEMSDRLKHLILKNQELQETIDSIQAESLQEQAKTISAHAQTQTAIAQYWESLSKANASAAKLARIKSMIENEDMEIQKWSNEIVRLESITRSKAENAKIMANKATYEAKEVLKIIQEKIENIQQEIANRPVPIILKMDLNLNYLLAGRPETGETIEKEKRETFINNILIELSNTFLVPTNRFAIENVSEGSIILTIKIFPAKSFDTRQLSHDQIAEQIIEQSNSLENSPIKLTKFLRFVQKVGVVPIDGVLTQEHAVEKPLDYNYEHMGYTMVKNAEEIDIIIRNSIRIEGLHNKNRTYYDEVNPFLKLEVKKFENIDKNIKNNDKLINSSYNVSKHTINYNQNLTSLFIYITLLVSIIFVLQSYFHNNIGFINVVGIIVFAILIAVFFMNIMRPVRTRVKNKYWGLPNTQLKRIS